MTSGRPWCRIALATLLTSAAVAYGHEIRPAYLQIEESAPGDYRVLWKQPVAGARLLPIMPVFPEGCTASASTVDAGVRDALVRRFTLQCPDGLHGETIAVDGLAGTITDVMLQVALLDGTRLSRLLKPSSPSAMIGGDGPQVLGYLLLGIEHLLFGYDHILFVVSLMFFTAPVSLVGGRMAVHPGALIKTITAFTAAHSVTLSFATLDLARLPQAPVEAVIALSILFLAVEKLRGTTDSITAKHTWIVAFVFGLLHGFGFAGALADIGLPKGNALVALLLFNLGVEIGQLAVVALGIALIWAVVSFHGTNAKGSLRTGRLSLARSVWPWAGGAPGAQRQRGAGPAPGRLRRPLPRPVVEAPLYVTGSLAAYWLVSRLAAIVG